MHDVFISYEHESKSVADNICSVLERNKIRCWYAPRDVIGDYATSIVNAITSAKVFILILNETSSNSRHVLNEVEIAYKIENDLTIVPFKVDDRTLSMAMEYYVKRLHWIDASSRSLDAAINDLTKKVAAILNIELHSDAADIVGTERLENRYFEITDAKEVARLNTQMQVMKGFDQPVYDRMLEGKKDLRVLDVGCNDGKMIADRVVSKGCVGKLVGLEYNQGAVDAANARFGSENARFYQCDIEDQGFERRLVEIMEENGIDAFDFVNISMVILHLKNPYKMMRSVRKHLAKDGVMIVKDIDDGLNFAYPDEDGSFDRVYRICNENETSGFRHSGRQVYTYMKRCGLKDIEICKSGLNTIGMDYNEKQALFDTYFSFILEDLKIMIDRHPDSERVKEDYDWYSENYDELEERFHSEDFIFSLGFMIYTARG